MAALDEAAITFSVLALTPSTPLTMISVMLPREYVHVEGAYPLLLLLGCDTASTAQQYANHIRYFRQAGAAAIVSTIATVFGPHAVKVGEKLLQTLLAIQRWH